MSSDSSGCVFNSQLDEFELRAKITATRPRRSRNVEIAVCEFEFSTLRQKMEPDAPPPNEPIEATPLSDQDKVRAA